MLEVKDALLNSSNDYYKLQIFQSLAKIKHSDKIEITNKVMSLDDLLQER